MSHIESCLDLKSHGMGEGAAGRDDSADQNTQCVSSDCISLDSSARERVLKEVGLTSTTFIGPAFPPEKNTTKPDIEDTLSEFYKELEKIDTPDGAIGNPGQQAPPSPPKTATSKQTQDVHKERSVDKSKSEETDGCQRSSGQTQSSWPHWYQNKPYYPRRPRPGMDHSSYRAAPTENHWYYPQPLNRPPNPRLHTPPFHQPPPLPAFLNPQNPSPHVNPNWSSSGVPNEYQEESNFQTFPQDYYGDYPHHLDRDYRSCSYNTYSDNRNIGWSREREKERYQCDEGYDRRQRYDSENELWEQQHHCQTPNNSHASHSSLVLILMRGLPGSGKSTLARELLSTGPNGLILSTDDYFDYKDGYHYEPGLLGVAHEWNQSRAKDAMYDCRSPIIIDNTNIQAWEMKPYVKMALERGYKVDFCEPDTSWKLDSYELEKRNKHGVPQEKIAQMLDRFSFPISVDIVMSSQEPPHVNQRHQPKRHRR